MGWFDFEGMFVRFVEKHREQLEAYMKQRAVTFLRDQLTLDNLPALRRVLRLAADQEFTNESWLKLEAVVRKYADPKFVLLGRANVTPDLEAKIKAAVLDSTGYDDALEIDFGVPVGTENVFMIPKNIWNNGRIVRPLSDLIEDSSVEGRIFESLTPPNIVASDPLFFLSRLTPVLALYFFLILLGHKERVQKLNSLLELLAVGVIPYRIEMKNKNPDEVCLCAHDHVIRVVVDRN